MVSFVLFDDNPRHNQTLFTYLKRLIPKLPAQTSVALITTEPGDVLAYAARPHEQTIYMLDLVLEQEQTGLDVCRAVRRADPDGLIIYVSAYASFTLDCMETHAFDFILKPYSPIRLENAILDAMRFLEFRSKAVELMITMGSVTRLIDQKCIRYIQAQREYVTAYLTDGQLTWRESLTRLMERLKPEWFVRIHKSYVFNRLYLKNVDAAARAVILSDGSSLPISRRELRAFLPSASEIKQNG